jgi:hypothetical protein
MELNFGYYGIHKDFNAAARLLNRQANAHEARRRLAHTGADYGLLI